MLKENKTKKCFMFDYIFLLYTDYVNPALLSQFIPCGFWSYWTSLTSSYITGKYWHSKNHPDWPCCDRTPGFTLLRAALPSTPLALLESSPLWALSALSLSLSRLSLSTPLSRSLSLVSPLSSLSLSLSLMLLSSSIYTGAVNLRLEFH